MVDECLFEQILNLASELRLELDRYLPSKLIERRLAETEHPMNCHQLKQRLERHGVNAATPITWTGQLIEGLGKRPMSYSVREIFTANNRLDYSEDDATCEG